MAAALHPLAEAVVRKALAGQPDPVAFLLRAHSDLHDLDTLARRIAQRPGLDAAQLLDLPVPVGNATLRRLSIAADQWLERVTPWAETDTGGLPILVIAFAMAHGRDPSALRAAGTSPDAMDRAVRDWAAGLTAPAEQIAGAVRDLLAEAVDPLAAWMPALSGEAAPMSAVVAMLVQETGLPSDYWLFEVSREAFLAACSALVEKAEAEADAAARAAKHACSPRSYAARAQWAFAKASRAFLATYAAPAAPEAPTP